MKNLLFILICLSIVIPCSAKIIYVDDDAPGGDGSSWGNAYKYLQEGLAKASSDPNVSEIWVGQGTYLPDANSLVPDGTGDREATFQLVNGVALLGGYAGVGEVDPNDRDWELYETVLSGDLEGDDDTVGNGENCYHVVNSNGTDIYTILGGFTITLGNANGTDNKGGGIYNISGNLTISNCKILKNRASEGDWASGAGIYITGGSPVISNCNFSENVVSEALGGRWPSGAGIYINGSSAEISNCNFSNNVASGTYSQGGGIYHQGGTPIITNCVFKDNYGGSSSSSNSGGGGIYSLGSCTISNCTFFSNGSPSGIGGGGAIYAGGSEFISNCIFTENSSSALRICGGPTVIDCVFNGNSSNRGGGIRVSGSGTSTITNCLFYGNSADYGGAIRCFESANLLITNCVFTDNSAGIRGGALEAGSSSIVFINNSILLGDSAPDGNELSLSSSDPTVTISHSNIQFGQIGVHLIAGTLNWLEGNIDTNPNFTDPTNNDYHLQSQAGRYDPTTQSWIKDTITSPCIDAGDPTTPISWEPYPNGGVVNMGAYGGTAEASKSYFDTTPCEIPIAGDINGDCKVDLIDYSIMSIHWLEDNN